MLILKIIFKIKKYYFNIFLNKNILKNNHYYIIKYSYNCPFFYVFIRLGCGHFTSHNLFKV